MDKTTCAIAAGLVVGTAVAVTAVASFGYYAGKKVKRKIKKKFAKYEAKALGEGIANDEESFGDFIKGLQKLWSEINPGGSETEEADLDDDDIGVGMADELGLGDDFDVPDEFDDIEDIDFVPAV